MNGVQSAFRARAQRDLPLPAPDRVAELLTRPLDEDGAVEIALRQNPRLRADLLELDVVEADRVQAGRLPNPGFTFSRLTRGDEVEIERTFTFSLLHLFTMPIARDIELHRFEQAQLQAAGEALRLVAQTRKAQVRAVAAQQSLRYQEQVLAAAETGSDLARRMAAAGNWSKLAEMRERAFHADALAGLARARHAALVERERLVRTLGLSGDAARRLTLPERLPDLPETPLAVTDAEGVALANRLDVLMARAEVDRLARSLELAQTTRFVNVLDLSYLRNSASGAPRQTGYEIEFHLPIFDTGDARKRKAAAFAQQAVQRTAAIAAEAQSQARVAHDAYRTAFDLARRYGDEIVPLRQQISEQTLLRYNGMLIGVFDVLADAREQVGAVIGAIETQRDFWLARADLDLALTVGAPDAAPPAAASAAAQASSATHGH